MLPPATERLWQRLQSEPLLAGWYLIGGTALSLRISHRVSEDLDFAWPQGKKLPRPALEALVRSLGGEGWRLERNDGAAAYEEFLLAGLSLLDYQQDFIAISDIGQVKLTFLSPDPPLSAILPGSEAPVPVIAPLPLEIPPRRDGMECPGRSIRPACTLNAQPWGKGARLDGGEGGCDRCPKISRQVGRGH